MQHTLITGGSGFIGSHFHQQMNSDEIINLDLLKPQFATNSQYVQGDIRESSCLEEALTVAPVKQIICLAAEHKDFGVQNDEYFQTNQYGTKVICDAATRHGVNKIVFYSSVAVYGHTSEVSNENTNPSPNSVYGNSKLAGEAVLKQWASEVPERSVLIFRPTVVFGERNFANMLRLIIQIDKGRYAHIGPSKNVKSIAYVKNIVEATLFTNELLEQGVHIFNYSDTPHLSVGEIANTISDSLNRKRPLTVPYSLAIALGLPFDLAIALTKADLPVSTMRIKKLLTETHHDAEKITTFGYNQTYTSIEGLQRMVNWYAEEKVSGRTPSPGSTAGG